MVLFFGTGLDGVAEFQRIFPPYHHIIVPTIDAPPGQALSLCGDGASEGG